MSPARGALRLGRAAVLGLACLLLSLSGHVLAGGRAPSPLALLVLAVPVACLSVLMTGERAGAYRIALTLAVTQVGLHEAFMLLAQPGCAPAAMPAHAHASGHLTAVCAPAMAMPGTTATMLVAHVTAAAATGLLLWQGERLLWALLTWLAVTLPVAPDPAAPPAVRRTGPVAVRRVARSVIGIGGVGRRGPPALAAA